RREPRPSPATVVAALGLCALTLLLAFRTDVVRAAPGAASLYARIGLPVNVRGLEIARVTSVEEMENGVPMLLVSGEIGNVSGETVEVPRLRLAVLAGDGRELYAWTTVSGRRELAEGETATFRARLASPPAEGRRIAVRFLNSADLPHGDDGA
ncbi:FxLYD domain-containing protein, partial [Methylopila musalis]